MMPSAEGNRATNPLTMAGSEEKGASRARQGRRMSRWRGGRRKKAPLAAPGGRALGASRKAVARHMMGMMASSLVMATGAPTVVGAASNWGPHIRPWQWSLQAGEDAPPQVDRRIAPLPLHRKVVVLSLGAGIGGFELALLALGAYHVSEIHLVDTDPSLAPFYADLPNRWASWAECGTAPRVSTALGNDVHALTASSVCARLGPDDHLLVLGGWDCRSRSSAGAGLGLFDSRSDMFVSVARLLAQLQAALPDRVSYLLENVPVGAASETRVGVLLDEYRVREVLGAPLVFDAVEFGSHAARVRAFWTNLFPQQLFDEQRAHLRPLLRRPLAELLDPGRHLVPCTTHSTPSPGWRINTFDEPVRVFPCFTSRWGSYGFVMDPDTCIPRHGVVLAETSTGLELSEPSVAERERCMGYPEGFTALEGWSDTARVRLLGQSIDQHAAAALWSVAHMASCRSDLGGEAMGAEGITGDAVAKTMADPDGSVNAAVMGCAWFLAAAAALEHAAAPAAEDPAARVALASAEPSASAAEKLRSLLGAMSLDASLQDEFMALGEPEELVCVLHAAAREASSTSAAHVRAVTVDSEEGILIAAIRGLNLARTEGSAAEAVRAEDNEDSELLEALGGVDHIPLVPPAGPQPITLEDIDIDLSPLPPATVAAVMRLLKEYIEKGLFASDLSQLGEATGVPMRIKVKAGSEPVWQKPRRLSPADTEVAIAELRQLLEFGIVRHSLSAWCANIVMVAKKDGARRMCVDNRPLNRVTEDLHYPMGTVQEIFDRVGQRGSRWFSVCDLFRGFWQVPIHEDDRHLTAFSSPLGQLEFCRVNFGLKTAPASFFSKVDRMLMEVDGTEAFVDDCLTNSVDPDSHVEDLREFFEACLRAGFRLNPKKCKFFRRIVEYVGHTISGDGAQPTEDKLRAVRDAPQPRTVRELQSFNGLANYLRMYVADFSTLLQPLTRLTKKDVAFVWGPEQEAAFQLVKEKLCSAPVLRFVDPKRRLTVATDWSVDGVGAVLSQVDDEGREYICGYLSRTCSAAERRYHPYKGELMAVIYAVGKWRHYLGRAEFDLLTDHQSLEWLFTAPELPPMLARWVLRLDEFNISVKYRPGKENLGPDYLSRYPAPLAALMDVMDPGAWGGEEPLVGPAELRRLAAALALTSGARAAEETVVRTVMAEALAAAAGDAEEEEEEVLDVEHLREDPWLDEGMLLVLRAAHGGPTPSAHLLGSRLLFDRAQHRARRYQLEVREGGEERLFQLGVGGRWAVPPPGERRELVRHAHAGAGGAHVGAHRTYAALRGAYYWPNMYGTVLEVVRECSACSRANAHRHLKHPLLQPLPIRGLFYRISIDLAGPFTSSIFGSVYILVVIEHLSKAVWLYGIPSKEPQWVRQKLDQLFGSIGAVAELVSDRGPEWEGALQESLARWQIDHRRSSSYHPASNGLCERAVQTVKSLLTRMVAASPTEDWETLLPWAQLAINNTPQASTGLPPNLLLYGRCVGIPPAGAARMSVPLQLEDTWMVVEDLLDRMMVLRSAIPYAMGNLEIAQHRDMMYYMRRKAGAGFSRLALEPLEGQLVYLKDFRREGRTFDAPVLDRILLIVEVLASGNVLLMGSDGRVLPAHTSHLAPCHMTHVDLTVRPEKEPGLLAVACVFCRSVHADQGTWVMALCDGCQNGFHLSCMEAKSWLVPTRSALRLASEWYCRWCCRDLRAPPGTSVEGLLAQVAKAPAGTAGVVRPRDGTLRRSPPLAGGGEDG